jgi:Polyketide cyclase / dehydrase and lipid transport
MKFENSVVIGQPMEQVFEFVTNPRNNAKWQTDILELELTSENHLGLGTAYRCRNRFMGKYIESEGVITVFVPGKACSIRITTGVFSGECSMLFEAVSGGTKFTASGDIDTRYFKLLKMIVKRKINQQIKRDMLKLRYILENGKKS